MRTHLVLIYKLLIQNDLLLIELISCLRTYLYFYCFKKMFVSNYSMVEGPPIKYYGISSNRPVEYFSFFRPFHLYHPKMERNEDLILPGSPNSTQVRICF